MAPGGTYIIGLSVPGPSPTTLLLRAVGPTLTTFGIPNPVMKPGMQVFDSNGYPLIFDYVTAPVDEANAPFFAAIGAFPLTGGESFRTAYNCGIFSPGSYTVRITDASGLGGTVLFEVYEIPSNVVTPAEPVVATPISIIIPGPIPSDTYP
jgi:hypothetical protein